MLVNVKLTLPPVEVSLLLADEAACSLLEYMKKHVRNVREANHFRPTADKKYVERQAAQIRSPRNIPNVRSLIRCQWLSRVGHEMYMHPEGAGRGRYQISELS